PRRPGDGGRRLQSAAIHDRLAYVGVWRDGTRGGGQAGDAPRTRRNRRPDRARAPVRGDGRRGVRARAGGGGGVVLRDRRRERTARQPPLDQDAARRRCSAVVGAAREAAPERRRLVARAVAAQGGVRWSRSPWLGRQSQRPQAPRSVTS